MKLLHILMRIFCIKLLWRIFDLGPKSATVAWCTISLMCVKSFMTIGNLGNRKSDNNAKRNNNKNNVRSALGPVSGSRNMLRWYLRNMCCSRHGRHICVSKLRVKIPEKSCSRAARKLAHFLREVHAARARVGVNAGK